MQRRRPRAARRRDTPRLWSSRRGDCRADTRRSRCSWWPSHPCSWSSSALGYPRRRLRHPRPRSSRSSQTHSSLTLRLHPRHCRCLRFQCNWPRKMGSPQRRGSNPQWKEFLVAFRLRDASCLRSRSILAARSGPRTSATILGVSCSSDVFGLAQTGTTTAGSRPPAVNAPERAGSDGRRTLSAKTRVHHVAGSALLELLCHLSRKRTRSPLPGRPDTRGRVPARPPITA
jgi:hypothetical protein